MIIFSMHSQVRNTIAITLLLAAALLAMLFASSVVSPRDSSAHPCDSESLEDLHEDFNRTVLRCNEHGHQGIHRHAIEVDGGRDKELEFKVYPPPNDPGSYLDANDQIVIAMPDFDLSRAQFDDLMSKIFIAGSRDEEDNLHSPAAPVRVEVTDDALVLTLPELSPDPPRFEVGEYIEITIMQGTGILTPEVPRGFDDDYLGYLVTITFIDKDHGESKRDDFVATDQNVVVVKNPISSTVPSATVRVELVTYTGAVIGGGEEIVVDFSGPSADSEFVVPTSITPSRVTVSYTNTGPSTKPSDSFNPSEILVQGAKVTLTIPTGTSPKVIPEGEFTIIFSNLARIRNPFAAGNRVIRVSTFIEGNIPDRITAVISRTTTIDTLEGPRGTDFTLEGKGYARGTVTIYHDADNDYRIDAGETLDSVDTVRGAFRVTLTARGETGNLVYLVRTKDSEGVDDEVAFLIRSGMFFEPAKARVGSLLQITILDWQDSHQDVAAVSIAGESAYVPSVSEYTNCFDYNGVYRANREGTVFLEVEVPRDVPGGRQTVSLYDHEQLEHYRLIDGVKTVVPDKGSCTDLPEGEAIGDPVGSDVKARLKSEPIAVIKNIVEIDSQDLVLSPASAARGQEITITGSGFSRVPGGINHIDSVWVGGNRVVDADFEFSVGTSGDAVLKVAVPLNVADGANEVRIEGGDHTLGQATLTIPEATIGLEPAQGQRDTEFKITGMGFIARETVIVEYGPEEGASSEAVPLTIGGALADSQGNFELTMKVPINTEVGKSYRVTAAANAETGGSTVTVDAESSHLVSSTVITTSPESVFRGDHLVVRGTGLPPFTLVGPIVIGGISVAFSAGVATDEEGSFEVKVLVPHIDYGDQILEVQVAGVIVPHIIEIVPPPLTGPPEQVFKYLIQAGSLIAVWRYDDLTKVWSLFDPHIAGHMAELNDLKSVSSGDIVWVNMGNTHHFQGDILRAGWNLIVLN